MHNVTKRKYIGSTDRGTWRIDDHLKALRRGNHPNEYMQNDFNEHGEDYSFYCLDVIPTHFHKDREYYWMAVFETYDKEKGYNCKDRAAQPINIENFPEISKEEIEPIKNRDLISCYEKVAKHKGISIEELIKL